MDTCRLLGWVISGHNLRFVVYYENQENIMGFLPKMAMLSIYFMTFIVVYYTLR